MMILLVMTAMLSMAGTWLLSGQLHPAAHVHLAFALGVMPMIMGAMLHFVPVLTRSRAAERQVARLPALAWMGGALISAFFIFSLPEIWRNIAALLALIACLVLGLWQIQRSRAALGGAHPGVRWYLAALFCLTISLLAVLSMSLWPVQYLALKRLHLHLNLFGFIGLTAIGTLQVLLPTAAGLPDPQIANRLRKHLPYALTGTVLISLGAAWWPPLCWPGLVLWLIPLAQLLRTWISHFRSHIFCLHGAAPLLASALSGFVIALIAGSAHGAGWIHSTDAAHLYVFAFLFPLVSGAAGQLPPLWLKPGRQTEWHAWARHRLTFAAGIRALLFLLAGIATGFNGASYLALAAILAFVLSAVSLLWSRK
ncbi:MAG: hypothetical protein WC736_06010 [Gallionella sp.]|jgi:hypothetical protein